MTAGDGAAGPPRAWPERHADLLRGQAPRSDRALDAILVSAFRPAENLRDAMLLAGELRCRLVILCSGSATAAEALALAGEVGAERHAVVEIPSGYDQEVIPLRTDAASETSGGIGDLSTKRNVGLLLSHLAGWQTVLFLDDDIRALTLDLLLDAVAELPPGGAVGMPARDFPDNSVVCHANRRTGYQQDVFVSGSALVVDSTEVTSFFPGIYNEDWLFMAPAVARGAVTEVGATRQLAYDPFVDPELAGAQEFGNVLADGLMNLLHQDGLDVATQAQYWQEFLSRRKSFIGGIVERTKPEDDTVLAALASAEKRRAAITPAELTNYVSAWQRDLVTWTEGVARLPTGLPFHEAVGVLGLAGETTVSTNFDRGSAP